MTRFEIIFLILRKFCRFLLSDFVGQSLIERRIPAIGCSIWLKPSSLWTSRLFNSSCLSSLNLCELELLILHHVRRTWCVYVDQAILVFLINAKNVVLVSIQLLLSHLRTENTSLRIFGYLGIFVHTSAFQSTFHACPAWNIKS